MKINYNGCYKFAHLFAKVLRPENSVKVAFYGLKLWSTIS